jgi:hypothetical protein
MKKSLLILLSSALVLSFGSSASASINSYDDYNWHYPVANTTVNSDYGPRTINGNYQFHKGIDLNCYEETIEAVADGTIASAGTFSDGTKYVALRTNDGDPYYPNLLMVRYLHLKSTSVSTNDSVDEGDPLGITGNTGGVGYHLHFDVNNGNTYNGGSMDEYNTIDPFLFWPDIFGESQYPQLVENISLTEDLSATEQDDSHDHEHIYDSEHLFEDTLTDYVGESEFLKWLYSIPNEKNRTVSAFKEYFGISDDLETQIKAADKAEAEKKNAEKEVGKRG